MFRQWLNQIKEREAAHEFQVGFSYAAYRILHCKDTPEEYKYLELFGPHYEGEEAARTEIQQLKDLVESVKDLRRQRDEYKDAIKKIGHTIYKLPGF